MKRIGLHFEEFCNDTPAPAWVELPPPKSLRDMTESDFGEALQVNGEAEPKKAGGVSTDPDMAAIASEGVSPCRPAEALPPHAPPSAPVFIGVDIAQPDSDRSVISVIAAPFKVGDKVMFDNCSLAGAQAGQRNWEPRVLEAVHVDKAMHFVPNTSHVVESWNLLADYRRPTPAELAEHWPDEWIPCTDEAQRLGLGDAMVTCRLSDGEEWIGRAA